MTIFLALAVLLALRLPLPALAATQYLTDPSFDYVTWDSTCGKYKPTYWSITTNGVSSCNAYVTGSPGLRLLNIESSGTACTGTNDVGIYVYQSRNFFAYGVGITLTALGFVNAKAFDTTSCQPLVVFVSGQWIAEVYVSPSQNLFKFGWFDDGETTCESFGGHRITPAHCFGTLSQSIPTGPRQLKVVISETSTQLIYKFYFDGTLKKTIQFNIINKPQGYVDKVLVGDWFPSGEYAGRAQWDNVQLWDGAV